MGWASLVVEVIKLIVDLFNPVTKETASEATPTAHGPKPDLDRVHAYLDRASGGMG